MKKIAIDMSLVVHGSRAIRHCTTCMVSELLKYKDMEFNLFYFDYKRQTQKYLRPLENHATEKVIPVPYRLLIPAWRRLSWPYLEMISPGCDLLYTNEFYFPPPKNSLVLATIHGLAYKVIPEKISSKLIKSLNKGLSFILKHADYLIAVSETTKSELINHVGLAPERIYVVTHGVNKRFRKQENQQEVRSRLINTYDLEQPYILYVGSIGMHKNIMGILSAFRTLSNKTSHHLVLAGPPDSAWNAALRFVAEHNMRNRVHFLGYVDQAGNNLIDLYNGADLFVFPSFYEGWASPPLEAMACGTPVITSNCSSLPETVAEAAIQVDPDNPEKLAHEMERVLSNKSLKNNLTTMGMKHAASHTWKKAAAKLINVFADIQARGSSKRQRE
jgi:glycosyltransferase involved in cell wall biosynthesis